MGRKRAGQPRAVRNTVAGRFGRRLEQLATAAGLTTAEFARKAGVTEDAIRKYYRGTDTPRLDRWPRRARAQGLKNAKDLLPGRLYFGTKRSEAEPRDGGTSLAVRAATAKQCSLACFPHGSRNQPARENSTAP